MAMLARARAQEQPLRSRARGDLCRALRGRVHHRARLPPGGLDAARGPREPGPRARTPTRRRGRRDRARPLPRADLVVETKPDLTPVTEADRAVETRSAAILGASAAGDAILGEEEGADGAARGAGSSTRSTGRGTTRAAIPVWATLIALEEDGPVPVGVVSAPGARAALVGRARRGSVRERRADPRLADARRRGRSALVLARERARRGSRGAAGMRVASATSGRTCSSPKAPSTERSTQSASPTGTSPPCRSSSRRPAGVHRLRGRAAGRRRERDDVERAAARRGARRGARARAWLSERCRRTAAS